MISTMDYFPKCACSSGGGIEDVLACAPCPPPTMSYSELKTFALRRLCQTELCSIASRCRIMETYEMTTDCKGGLKDVHSASVCDSTCFLIIACLLSAAFLVILTVVVCRRKINAKQTQDTINVIFNDTDSDSNDKSSEKGTVNMAMTKTRNSELSDGRQVTAQSESSVVGTSNGTNTRLAHSGSAQHEMVRVADVHSHTNDIANGRSPEKI